MPPPPPLPEAAGDRVNVYVGGEKGSGRVGLVEGAGVGLIPKALCYSRGTKVEGIRLR